MDTQKLDHRQIIANAKSLQKTATDTLARAKDAVAHAKAILPTNVAMPTSRLPPCPRCHRIDLIEEEEQTGSSQRWFVCNRCGFRYSSPPARRR